MSSSKKVKSASQEPKKITAYTRYFKECQKKLVLENPVMTFGEISKEVGKRWKNLSAHEKEKYHVIIIEKEEKEEKDEKDEKDEKRISSFSLPTIIHECRKKIKQYYHKEFQKYSLTILNVMENKSKIEEFITLSTTVKKKKVVEEEEDVGTANFLLERIGDEEEEEEEDKNDSGEKTREEEEEDLLSLSLEERNENESVTKEEEEDLDNLENMENMENNDENSTEDEDDSSDDESEEDDFMEEDLLNL
jgi:hypothetical protein